MKSTAFAIAAMTTFSALAAQKIQMPLTCTNPDGLAVAPSGRLVIAAPNNARTQPGSIFYIDKPGAAPCKWFSVPLHPDTGCAAPMGICFGPDGALYVCDNQRDSKGRLLRITFKGEAVATCETVACGLENANGVKFLDGRLYMTQAFLRKIKRVNDYQAMLQKYDEAFESEIKNFNELTFVGRCVRLEAELT